MKQIIHKLDTNGCFDHQFVIDVEGHTGTLATATLRLSIARRSANPRCWSIALLIHNERFDGIDYESHFKDWKGNRRAGWHRHVWDSDELHARRKESIDGFDTITEFPAFLSDACSALRILLEDEEEREEAEDETSGMLFD